MAPLVREILDPSLHLQEAHCTLDSLSTSSVKTNIRVLQANFHKHVVKSLTAKLKNKFGYKVHLLTRICLHLFTPCKEDVLQMYF